MKNKLIVYYGDGEGKTSAALGHVVRGVSYGKVAIIQFMKARSTGEYKILSRLKNVEIYLTGVRGFLTEKTRKEHEKAAEKGIKLSKKILNKKLFLVILDEILYAIEFGLINEREFLKILKKRKSHVILTGRKASKRILKIADIATKMKKIKHYYKKDERTVKGIDY